jgi:antirestriction protein ArdC
MATSTYADPAAEHPAWEQLLKDAVEQPGTVSAAYSAFHSYSLGNQLLALFQCAARGIRPGPIATFMRWKELGRSVRKGEKALTLCQPRTYAKRRTADEADDEDAELGVIFSYRRAWSVLSQTDGDDYVAPELPGWDKARAIEALGLAEVPFEATDGNVMGYSLRGKFAVSPLSPWPAKTTFHELGHCILHLDAEHREGAELPRNLKEIEAESVALLCSEALGLDGAAYARGYVQDWLQGETIPEASARRIFSAADRILKAGRDREVSAT